MNKVAMMLRHLFMDPNHLSTKGKKRWWKVGYFWMFHRMFLDIFLVLAAPLLKQTLIYPSKKNVGKEK